MMSNDSANNRGGDRDLEPKKPSSSYLYGTKPQKLNVTISNPILVNHFTINTHQIISSKNTVQVEHVQHAMLTGYYTI